MRVGFDITIAGVNQAGSAFYARSLAEALPSVGGEAVFHFFDAGQRRQMGTRKTLQSRLRTLYLDVIWTHLSLPLQAWHEEIEILHMPAGIVPMLSPCRSVVTILDATPLLMPANFPFWQRTYMRALMPFSARRAKRILTISEHSKRDIVAGMGIDPHKITVTYPAASPSFQVLERKVLPRVIPGLGNWPYVLAVGTLEPRKNMIRLLRAFALLRRDGRRCQLVHAGPRGWMYDDIMREVHRLDLGECVHFLGRVALDDLVRLYNGALMLVYPSLYEGFGLPVLEAMACGCPVVTSDRSSLPEVAGGSAILADPENVNELREAIESLLDDKVLADEMRRRGILRASEFSWRRCAQQTLSVYREALDD